MRRISLFYCCFCFYHKIIKVAKGLIHKSNPNLISYAQYIPQSYSSMVLKHPQEW